jgi:ElaB/YqjD/DUF883 family membrane-anchored ribosome-binding protein
MADASKSGPAASVKQGEQRDKKEASAGGAVETVKESVKDMAAAVADATGQAKEKVQQWSSTAVAEVKDRAHELASVAADKAEDVSKEFTGLIRRYPLPALLVGCGLGFLLGRVTRSNV